MACLDREKLADGPPYSMDALKSRQRIAQFHKSKIANLRRAQENHCQTDSKERAKDQFSAAARHKWTLK
jgi:hypothetical protein